MKTVVVPIPVDIEIARMVAEGARATGLKKADVMRQGLRLGVPALVERLMAPQVSRPPKFLAYIDNESNDAIDPRTMKKALRAKLAKKYDRANR
jgi:hypothetical protein